MLFIRNKYGTFFNGTFTTEQNIYVSFLLQAEYSFSLHKVKQLWNSTWLNSFLGGFSSGIWSFLIDKLHKSQFGELNIDILHLTMTCNICLFLYVHILLAETGYQCLITKMMCLRRVHSSRECSTQPGLRVTAGPQEQLCQCFYSRKIQLLI